jgi:hypothetical protein
MLIIDIRHRCAPILLDETKTGNKVPRAASKLQSLRVDKEHWV